MLKPKEVLLSDGVTYAPAFVSVNADGSINTGGGNTTMGNITLNVTGLASSAEQSNQTVLLTAIRDNTANSSTNITTLSTAAKQDQQNANLSLIANQTQGLASLTVQNNHTGLLQTISNNTANKNVTVTNLTTLSTLSEQQNQTTALTNLTVEAGKHTANLSAIVNQTVGLATLTAQNNHTGLLQTIANNTANGSTNITTLATSARQDQQNANLSLIANQTLGVANATNQVTQTTLLTNLTTAAANQSTSLTTLTNQTSAAIFRTDNTPTLTTLGSTGAWIDTAVNGQTKFELVLALGTAATVPVVAFQADYSTDGTAIVETTQTLTGVESSAVSLGGIECKPTRVRCVVKTAGVTLGLGAKVIITGSK